MESRPTILETLERADPKKMARVINIETEGEPIVLVSSKEGLPAAFIFWTKNLHSPGSSIRFHDYDNHGQIEHSLVCACKPISTVGATMRDDLNLTEDEWTDVLEGRFRREIYAVCKKNDIHTLFVHHSKTWANVYRMHHWEEQNSPLYDPRITVYEGKQAYEYNQYVDSYFPFIDWQSSQFTK